MAPRTTSEFALGRRIQTHNGEVLAVVTAHGNSARVFLTEFEARRWAARRGSKLLFEPSQVVERDQLSRELAAWRQHFRACGLRLDNPFRRVPIRYSVRRRLELLKRVDSLLGWVPPANSAA